MKTIEFKLQLDKSQQLLIDSWLDSLRFVWNLGLELLLEYHQCNYYDKQLQKTLQYQIEQVKQEIKDLKKQKLSSADKKVKKQKLNQFIQRIKLEIERLKTEPPERRGLKFERKFSSKATSTIAIGEKNKYLPVCARLLPSNPRLKRDTYMGLTGYLTKTRLSEYQQFKGMDIPMTFIKGTLYNLAKSWKAYADKDYSRVNAHIPKFKSKLRGDKITSLYCIQPDEITVLEDKVKCPGVNLLGKLKVVNHGLAKRWKDVFDAQNLRIVKRPSGYYLQLIGEITTKPEKPSNKACGIDVGLQYIYSDDVGKQIDPPKYYRKAQKRLRRLQRKQARQESYRKSLLGEARKLKKQILTLPKDSKVRTEAENKILEIIKGIKQPFKNELKTKHKIALTHEKIRLRRRNFNHKLSTYLVRTFGAISVEDIKISNLNRRPQPKKREDGKGWERNNAKAKSGLNKSFADAGLGQLLTMIKDKAEVSNREFIKVKPHYTSQDCPRCGHRQKKALSQRTHRCSECSYIAPRDVAAAINIRAKADFNGSYPALTGKVKPLKDSQQTAVKQESVQEESILIESGCDAPTIPSRKRAKNNRKQKKNCAVLSRCKSQSIPEEAQSFDLSSLEGDLDSLSLRAPDTASNTENLTKGRKRKRRKSNPTALEILPIQLELDLWNPAGEISSNTS
ncbi:MAG: type V CRISPR-associated protein C2c8 [Xenococcaceae cyanobacterium MO_188.B29]|nr:type V CRISPR-associated protein C2c8 [Xenococcaceae cyanobacterium MO_188.B29]